MFKNSTKEVEALVNAKPDVLQWDTSDVLAWLRTSMPGLFEVCPEFTRRAQDFGLDGYLILQMTSEDEDLISTHLKVEKIGLRKQLMRQVRILQALWLQLSSEPAEDTQEELPRASAREERPKPAARQFLQLTQIPDEEVAKS